MGRPRKATVALRDMDACAIAMTDLLVAREDVAALESERNLAVAAAGVEFEGRLDLARTRASGLEASLEEYCELHRTEIEAGGRKSVKLATGVMGWRKSPPALKPLNRSFNWPRIAELVKAATGLKFFRAADPQLDRQKIKDGMDEEKLRNLGMKLESAEEFYANPGQQDEVTW